MYLQEKFPKTSDAKIKDCIFVGPQIRKLIKDPISEEKLSNFEKPEWKSFKNIVEDCL